MNWTKRTTQSGELVRAGLDWGSTVLLGTTVEQLCNNPHWRVRLHSEVPQLVIPPPPVIPWEDTQQARMEQVHTAFRAAGSIADPRMCRAKMPSKSRWDTIDRALEVLSAHQIDCWTWSLYAAKNQWGRYPPTMHRWFTPKAVSDWQRAEWLRPPVAGWITPTKLSTKIYSVREHIRGQILKYADFNCDIDEIKKLVDEFCTEKEFQGMLDNLAAHNNSYLLSLNKKIQKGEWPWPTLRALGPRE